MNYVITSHAAHRFMQRVGANSVRDASEQIARLVDGKRPTERLPNWAVHRPEENVHLHGVVIAKTWTAERLRPGWRREVKVAFPVVERGGKQVIVTTLIKRGETLRLAS